MRCSVVQACTCPASQVAASTRRRPRELGSRLVGGGGGGGGPGGAPAPTILLLTQADLPSSERVLQAVIVSPAARVSDQFSLYQVAGHFPFGLCESDSHVLG